MKIILLKDIPKIGKKGHVSEVNDGYAKNFLIAKKLAAPATPEIQARVAKEAKEATDKHERSTAKLKELKAELEKRTFSIQVKMGDKGQIFGGAHDKDIIEVINKKLGSALDKHTVQLNRPIKNLGAHTVTLKLGSGITAQTTINIEPLS